MPDREGGGEGAAYSRGGARLVRASSPREHSFCVTPPLLHPYSVTPPLLHPYGVSPPLLHPLLRFASRVSVKSSRER